ncbi:hypothetical protein GOODEAATRI_033341 [Goodea atripinnis]|uniref:Transposase Helix-turn-helix domain-containing protein n=1 Tax=Goodea atripinnis TaxID=208336 RepID=A0ABV0NGS1_9TELE
MCSGIFGAAELRRQAAVAAGSAGGWRGFPHQLQTDLSQSLCDFLPPVICLQQLKVDIKLCVVVVMGVLCQILPCLPQTGRKLSPFQMLLLTLMHLRLNLPIQHMADLFCIDRLTVSTMFTNTIDVMFTHLAAG